jgi:hypothetical protein
VDGKTFTQDETEFGVVQFMKDLPRKTPFLWPQDGFEAGKWPCVLAFCGRRDVCIIKFTNFTNFVNFT